MRALALLFTLISAGALAAPVTLQTRGQTELFAQREATDAAVADLRDQALALHVTEAMTLTAWLASRPVETVQVEQALRDAEVTRDESAEGRWHHAVRLRVGDLNTALEGSLRRRLVEASVTTLTGRGSAEIPAVGTTVDTGGSTPQNP